MLCPDSKAVLLAARSATRAAGKLNHAMPYSAESKLATAIVNINAARVARSRRDITCVRQSRAA
jgi:hypothetical protein